ncbi:MAG: DUF5723 family protein [Bacteroidota bacterium]|nr:DUF5723 family protein [Bacteroidota bacterium]
MQKGVLGVLLVTTAFAQLELSDAPRTGAILLGPTVATDYQALWVNPANLGFVPQTVTFSLGSPMEYGKYRLARQWSFGLLEAGASFSSDALRFAQVAAMVLRFEQQRLSMEDKYRYARDFAGRGVAFNFDVQLFAGAFQSAAGWGGIGIGIRDRINAMLRFNSMLSRIAFLGRLDRYFDSIGVNWRGDTVGYARRPQYYSTLFDSSRLGVNWLRDYALGYGLQLYDGRSMQFYAGLTLRYIEGYIMLDGRIDNRVMTARSAISPFFDVNYGKATTPSLRQGSGLIPVGRGYGVDGGVTVVFQQRWRAAIAVLDMGSVLWDGNVFAALDTVLNGMITTGFSSFDLFAEAQNITGEGGYFKWTGLPSVRTLLPMRLRLGLSHSIGVERDIGVEATIPLRPSAPAAPPLTLSIGTRYSISDIVLISGGIRFGTLTIWSVPISVQITLWNGRWEIGLSFQDIASLLIPKHPTLSLSLALLRFHF